MVILMAGVIFTEPDVDVDADAGADADVELKNKAALWSSSCQEPTHTKRMSSIFLRFLMVIMMVGVIFIEPDVDVDTYADADAEVMSWVEK